MSDDFQFPPEFLEEFEILEVAGAGGMARVYRAQQKALGRTVAIKVLAPQAFSEEDSKKRFQREREISSQLKHPNIVPLLSFGDAGERPYLVFEFIEGPSLRDVLLRQRRIELVRALRYARHVAQGLAAAHGSGIVHRDLKPDNVLISDPGDEARVADFGLARETKPDPAKQRLTQAGIILGTPGYLSPELIRGDAATPAADLFALGIMLFEMITGYLPLDAGSEHELLIRYLREDLPPLSSRGIQVPQRVERIVAALLRRDLAKRANDASKVAEALAAAEAKGDTPDRPGVKDPSFDRPRSRGLAVTRAESRDSLAGPRLTPFSGAPRFVRQNPGVSAAAVAMLCALIMGAIVTVAALTRPAPAPKVALTVSGAPMVVAGVTSASIRWQTSKDVPTALWVWPEGKSDQEGIAVRPPAGAPPGGLRHELTVRGMAAGQRWLFNVIFPDGTRSPSSYPIDLRGDIRSLIEHPAFRYLDSDTVEVAFDVKEDVTAGVVLTGATEQPPVWAPGRGKRRVELQLKVPPVGEAWQPAVLFRELDDASGDNTARNRVELPRFATLAGLRKQLATLFAPPHALDLTPICNDVLRTSTKYYSIKHSALPTKPLVKALEEVRRQQLLEEAYKIARQKLLIQRGLDLDQVKSALPLFARDATVPVEERRKLHAGLMRLADLDGAAEIVAGAPLLDIVEHVGMRVKDADRLGIAMDAYHPLDHYDDPLVKEVVTVDSLPLFSHSNFGEGEKMVGLWVLAGGTGGIIDCVRKLAIADPEDPKMLVGMSERLPPLPSTFPLDGPVRVVVKAASLSPEYRLWLRFGKDAAVCFRITLAEFHGYISTPMKATRQEVESKALTLAVDLPAGWIPPGTTELAIRLEDFPTHEGGTAPMTCWISDIALFPVK